MGTNEPGDGSGYGPSGDQAGGPNSGETRPVDLNKSYSGYHEGAYGEPVPDSPYEGSTAAYPPPPTYPPTAQQPPYPPPGPPGTYPPPPYGGLPGPPYGGYPAYRPTNGMAIAAMILGILWLFWVGSILALIFGYVSRQQIRERGEEGDGMAIAGIVLGWIGIAMFLLFVVLPFIFGLASSVS